MLKKIMNELNYIEKTYKKSSESKKVEDSNIDSRINKVIDIILEGYTQRNSDIIKSLDSISIIVDKIISYIEDGYFKYELKIYELKGTITTIKYLIKDSENYKEMIKLSNNSLFKDIMKMLNEKQLLSFGYFKNSLVSIIVTNETLSKMLTDMTRLKIISIENIGDTAWYRLDNNGYKWLKENKL